MSTRVVVGAAIIRQHQVLAARRSAPAHHAGGWEFPGGKVEDGETDQHALARECHEELGVDVTVGPLLGSEPIVAGLELRVYRAAITTGEPVARQDHDELRWLSADALDDVPWLPADKPFLPAVRDLLR